MAMTKTSKENIKNADEIHIEQSHYDKKIWLIRVVKNGHYFYVPCNYKSKNGARRAVLRLEHTAPIF